jgi:hypothetical protein
LISAELMTNWLRRRNVNVVSPSTLLMIVNVLLPEIVVVVGLISRSRLQ